MAVLQVRAKNFKQHKDLDLKIDGKSFFVVGDTRQGKTNLIKIILATLMLEDFPENPISTGENEGFIEATHELDGMKYTIRRTFTDKPDSKTRFTVTDANGGKHTLSVLLERIFGKAFGNNSFNYQTYFFELKSTEARYQYLVKAIGGDQVLDNLATIKKLKRERGTLGTQCDTLQALIDDSSLNPDTILDDLEFYKEEKNTDEAIAKKAEKLLQRKSVINLNNQLEVISETNLAYQESETQFNENLNEIVALEKRIAELRSTNEKIGAWQKVNQPDFDAEKEIREQISTAEEDNLKIEAEADALYDDMVREVTVFNQMKAALDAAVINYKKWQEYNTEWTEKDDKIKALIEENETIFKKKLPIPELTIEEVDGKDVVMYNGRELSFDNISKGESIRIAVDIQKALNPKGNNLVVVPEAQSLGSDLDEILEQCKHFNLQAIVEVTERKQEFKIKFED